MANWAKLQEQLTGLPVAKRSRNSIHFDKGNGEIVANFSGKPCHYEENGEWKALDTAIKTLEDGSLGAKGVPVRLNLNGLVRIINENNEDLYSQVTTRVGVFNSTTRNLVDYINLPVGQVQDDLLIKDTDLYSHTLHLNETGLREEIVIKKKPAFITDKANLWLVLDTVVTGITFEDGWLDQFEIAQMHFPPPTATDAEGREGTAKRYAKTINGVQHIFTGLKFSELFRAAYPVTIDPDFERVAQGILRGGNANYATSLTTVADYSTIPIIGQYLDGSLYKPYRAFLSFDTSSIGAENNIAQVNMKMAITQDYSTNDFDVNILKADWSAYTPASARQQVYTILGSATVDALWRNTSGISLNTYYTSQNLDTTWINKTGTTYYGLRSGNEGSAPTDPERVYLDQWTKTITLSITYGSTGVPKHFLHYARLRSN